MNKAFLALLITSTILFNSCSTLENSDDSELNKNIIDATSAFNDGDYNKAEELFSMALQIDEDNEIALNNQILTLNKLDKNTEALELANQALKTYPDNLKFKIIKARLLKTLKQTEESILLYQKILKLATHEKYYHVEYLQYLLTLDFQNDTNIKQYIIDEAEYLLSNDIAEKEALKALCIVDKNNLVYSLLLKTKYSSQWNEVYNVNSGK